MAKTLAKLLVAGPLSGVAAAFLSLGYIILQDVPRADVGFFTNLILGTLGVVFGSTGFLLFVVALVWFFTSIRPTAEAFGGGLWTIPAWFIIALNELLAAYLLWGLTIQAILSMFA